MLSQKFEKSVRDIIGWKDCAKKCDENRYAKYKCRNRWEMQLTYNKLIMTLKQFVLSGNDAYHYVNKVCNGILSNIVENGNFKINQIMIGELICLNYFDPVNQKMIHEYLDALDVNYIAGQIGNQLTKHEQTVLDIHMYRMLQQIYFIWQSDLNLYLPDFIAFDAILREMDIQIKPIDSFDEVYYNIFRILSDATKINGVAKIIKHMEMLIHRYDKIKLSDIYGKPADLLFDRKNDTNHHTVAQPALAPVWTKVELDKYTLNVLKDMCKTQNIDTKGLKKKDEYIDAIMGTVKNRNNIADKKEVVIKNVEKIKVVKADGTKNKRVQVPRAIRMELWKREFGDTLKGKCYCCERELHIDNFEAGHIVAVANGGATVIGNLKVVCKQCNTSCSTKNLEEFRTAMKGMKKSTTVKLDF